MNIEVLELIVILSSQLQVTDAINPAIYSLLVGGLV